MRGVGDRYHESTKHRRGTPSGHRWDWKNPPELYKSCRSLEVLPMPLPQKNDGMPLWEALSKRRSLREYREEPITMGELSQLLWAAQGISGEIDGYSIRTAPSAGALYPIETYLVANFTEGIDRGIYHYLVREHALELLRRGDFRQEAAAAALDQEMCTKAGVVFVWTAVLQRTKWKYGERGYRYIYKDAAHICQNLYLASTALGLGCCAIGACHDREVDGLLGIDGEEEVTVYLASVGRIRSQKP